MQDHDGDGAEARRRVLAQLRVLGREMGEMSRRVSRSMGLHDTQLRAVDQLLRSEHLSPGDLSRRLGLSTGATTALIDNLEQLGHARRRPHPEDRRRVVLEATEHARQEGGQAFRPLGATFAAMLEGYDRQELEAIDRFLADLRRSIAEYPPPPASP
ncbi:MAG TPA: MarR family transcriptional regulator [Candidatus Dormibacteraeota bacterium]|jgi:DNA-binding MarR family transcriptional regulator|nr:MarR family transcriptional regulator [Candidatus Dormibacteraeota bacterium]